MLISMSQAPPMMGREAWYIGMWLQVSAKLHRRTLEELQGTGDAIGESWGPPPHESVPFGGE